METHHHKMPKGTKICVVPAWIGEPCEGWDETSQMPFPNCAPGLTCMESGQVTIPGEEKVCVIVCDSFAIVI